MSRVKYSWLRLSGHWWLLLLEAGPEHNGQECGELRALHWEWPGLRSSWTRSFIRGEEETIFIQWSSGPRKPPWQWNINYLLTPYWSWAVFQDGIWWPSYNHLDRDIELEIVCSSHSWSDGNFNHKQRDHFWTSENSDAVWSYIFTKKSTSARKSFMIVSVFAKV